ncbi:lycopene cyclase family protein [Streptomyces leeuwenhoekii]|uniref:Lycopene Cyclase n=1 Tax=Streptomyces leeuwenhoekii TaxID=1437453 RepID=A0A0F7W228_STRLW|nr:lycopene cyclase family protein [Streptomyces leeuwenhoekii]CQR66045.1 Lycopene Cyclase [Streptomyces leeuwenhoekii]
MLETGAGRRADAVLQADIVIVGAGAAGLSLAHRLPTAAPGHRAAPSVVLVEPPAGPLRAPRRTWCFWETGAGRFDPAVTASWEWLRVRDRHGAAVRRHIAPVRYKMIRSDDFEALVTGDLGKAPGVRRVEAAVDTVAVLPDGTAEVRGTDAAGVPVRLRGRWVFDSRPPPRPPAARTRLLQHFRGWFVRTSRPAFDPEVVDLMDFRTPQPARGLSFGYVLPTGRRTALVEYTEFGPAPLTADAYDAALEHYTRRVLGIGDARVLSTEQGVIPMTDAVFPRRIARSVFPIGAAGGATRAATGYTFSAVQRQSDAVARAVRAGRAPVPPPPHPARARMMDAVLLRALDTGRIDGPDFFFRLFARVPVRLLLRFLDGETRLYEDLSVGVRTPVLPMLRTAAEVPWLPRRVRPPAP